MPDTAQVPVDGAASQNRSIEDVLFENKLITPDQLNLVKLESVNSGKPIEQILKDHGFASSQDIIKARSEVLGIPYADLSAKAILPEVLGLVPETVARRYQAVPFQLDQSGETLSVAMADPLDINAISFLEKKTGKKIRPFLSAPEIIKSLVDERYNQNLTTEVSAALEEAPTVGESAGADLSKVEGIIRDAPVAKIASSLLDFAIKSRASDIHIEPLETHTRVRYRIDGILYEKLVLPSRIHDALVSRIKIMSELKIDEKRVPQDGRFNYKSGGNEVDVRVSTLPTAFGEKVVMRLLRKSGGVPTLQDLGLRGLALKNLETAILRPHGIIIVCGPTGSGKTTTLYSVLSKINSTKVNIVTLEDPVEYQIGGVNQVQINPAAGLTFATGLRSFLRQDPNVILVGEIRDGETTDLAIQAALTGHLVFSTLHTSNASGAIPRLLDLGGEAFLLASSMNAMVGQRILRKICPKCKEPYEPPEIMANDIRTVLGKYLTPDKLVNGKLMLYKGKGCSECGDSGFLGRVGIFEVLPVTDKIAKLVLTRADAGEIERQAVEEGMMPMKVDGYLKAVEGVTTIEEVLRVAQD
ncbi:Flp pilus assembly complex ATPase component TadA [Patescibacteria group bacterium]|nr:Flp pilus assembly complex ATPase component TadA [Patescibacteria group bacterium]